GAASAGAAQDLRISPADCSSVGIRQGFSDDAANIVFAQDRRIEAVSHQILEVGGQDLAQPRTEIRVFEAKRDRCFEKTELIAAIEASTLEAQPMKRLAVLDQPGKGIGELDLAPAARLRTGEVAKDLRLNDVTSDNRRGRRSRSRLRFFDHTPRLYQSAVVAY